MKTFKFENGDLVIDGSGNLELVYEEDEVVQSVRMLLLANVGEWFLDESFGLDYDAITDKGQSVKDIEFALREAIFQDDRVDEVLINALDIDSSNRKLRVDLEIVTNDGNTSEIEVNV